MKKIITQHSVPSNSIFNTDKFGKIDYCDSYQVIIHTHESVDKIMTVAFGSTQWVDYLMKLRDTIVGIFGLKTSKAQSKMDYYPIGSSAPFTVIDRNENEILMAEKDKHLNFLVSILVERNGLESTVNLTTIVHYNNFGGKLYFFPVKFFHQLIVKTCMKKLIADFNTNSFGDLSK